MEFDWFMLAAVARSRISCAVPVWLGCPNVIAVADSLAWHLWPFNVRTDCTGKKYKWEQSIILHYRHLHCNPFVWISFISICTSLWIHISNTNRAIVGTCSPAENWPDVPKRIHFPFRHSLEIQIIWTNERHVSIAHIVHLSCCAHTRTARE